MYSNYIRHRCLAAPASKRERKRIIEADKEKERESVHVITLPPPAAGTASSQASLRCWSSFGGGQSAQPHSHLI